MKNSSMKDHNLFKPKNFEEGQHAVVGDCNGLTMEERWRLETPLFAREILKLCPLGKPAQPKDPDLVSCSAKILDYGCGVGRMAKEILRQQPEDVHLVGVDASVDMMQEAVRYVQNENFCTKFPQRLELYEQFDVIYLIYVLQHVPAIEIRDVLARIHYHLRPEGSFVYCSSDYRMAIRYDGQGFFDDRFLGVNLRAEISRFFEPVRPLFDEKTIAKNPVLQKMVQGKDGLAHPAFVYKKKRIQRNFQEIPYFDMEAEPQTEEGSDAPLSQEVTHGVQEERQKEEELKDKLIEDRLSWDQSDPKKLLLLNRLAPGDILVMTNAIRDLSLAYPGKYIIDVRTPCPELFENNPFIKKLDYSEDLYNQINNRFSRRSPEENDETIKRILAGEKKELLKLISFIDDIMVVDMHYPMVHSSGVSGRHFSEGHRDWLEIVLGIKIPQSDIRPGLFLSQAERDWPSPALDKAGVDGSYWVINAGSKDDYSLKQYPFYQEVVNLCKDITFVQVGQKQHNHRSLDGVVDMVGKTNLRELIRLVEKAEGVLTCVSLPMHIAAAFSKPCVVVAGAREGTRWELYPNHQFLYVNGCLTCAPYDGCWRAKPGDCNNKRNNIPLCMLLIKPEDVVRAINRYYEGGILEGPYLANILTQGVENA